MESASQDTSLPLKGIHVCITTQTNTKEETEVVTALRSLGGEAHRNLYSYCDCVIVKVAKGSDKYSKATKQGIPCVTMDWVSDCVKYKAFLPFASYPVGPFTGLFMALTQVDPPERYDVQDIIEQNGGIFSMELVLDHTTHLVAGKAEGEKYKYAKNWGSVIVVSPKWVYDCNKAKQCLPEFKYLVDGAGQQKIKKEKEKKVAESQAVRQPRPEEVALRELLNRQAQQSAFDWAKLPSPLSVGEEMRNMFAADVFFINGFEAAQHDYLAQLVIAVGGKRHFVLATSVTKIILGPGADRRLVLEAHRHPCGAVCVNVQWLLDFVFPRKGERDMANGSQPVAKLMDVEDGTTTSETIGVDENDVVGHSPNKKQMNYLSYSRSSSTDSRDSVLKQKQSSPDKASRPGYGLRRTQTYHTGSSSSFGLKSSRSGAAPATDAENIPPISAQRLTSKKRSLSLSNRRPPPPPSNPHPTDESQFVSWAT